MRGADRYTELRLAITDVFERNHSCYGYRRLRASLGRQHVFISEKVMRRLMKQEGLIVAAPKRRRYGSYLGEISPAPDNLINRDFQAASPNEKWLTDITEFQIPAGKVYLSPMIDCFDGLVVSWTTGTRPDAALVNTMLDAAIQKVANRNDRPVVHSDRGGHYRWPGWLSRMHNAKLIRSMSRKGCSPDNRPVRASSGGWKRSCSTLGTGRRHPSSNSSRSLTRISTGITKSESKSLLAPSVPSNIERALDLWHKPVQVFVRIPTWSISNRRQQSYSKRHQNLSNLKSRRRQEMPLQNGSSRRTCPLRTTCFQVVFTTLLT